MDLSNEWLAKVSELGYSYHFTWMGQPIIQFPQDMVAMQEIIWAVKPDLIVETGIARGGSLIYYASLLELIGGDGRVLGIDIDVREHNRVAIEAHRMFKRIDMIHGSSVAPEVVAQVSSRCAGAKSVIVILDSNHTHDHVLAELQAYSPLVTKGGYLVVFDTVIEEMPADSFPDRPWGIGDNPATAVRAFLKTTDRFEIDRAIPGKLQVTVARSGYLRCIAD
ncbi:MAG: cephalosporin hydroxylase family protein [Acidobacteriota bacterium]